MNRKKVILTGDRPSGPLHIGHYVGSLANRVKLQDEYKQYIMLADVQALTDNYEHPDKVRSNVLEVALDYLSVGIDPAKSTIFIQSMIPQIAELTIFYLNLVTISRLKRNPTVKNEIDQKGYGDTVTAGFLMYPVSQAADITIVKAHAVPAGEDQLPMIEQTNELTHKFNSLYQVNLFPKVEAIVSKIARLVGTDGKAKMSKSLGNAIYLSDDADTVVKKVMGMYTDPNHIRVSDPGQVDGNPVFMYLDAFDPDIVKVQELKDHYARGGLGDVVIKRYLAQVLNTFLDPIRARRKELAQDKDGVMQIVHAGTQATQEVAEQTMREVREAMKIAY